MKTIKKVIVSRVIGLYLGFFLLALLIVGRILQLQLIQGEELKQKSERLLLKYITIEPNRGDIYATGGKRLLATSVPIFDIRMDVASTNITDELFTNELDALCAKLSDLFGDRSAREYRQNLTRERRAGNRYYLIKRNVSYDQYKALQTFPIGYTEGISNTQRYKALGNSFTVSVIQHILSNAFSS